MDLRRAVRSPGANHQIIKRHDPVEIDEQNRQQAALSRMSNIELSAFVPHLDRSEKPELRLGAQLWGTPSPVDARGDRLPQAADGQPCQ
jgi:hypothetical protein